MGEKTVSLEIENLDEISWVRVTGEISDDGILDTRRVVLDLLAGDVARILPDLSGVRYVSSSGIGMMVSLLKRCHKDKVPFAVTGLNADLRELFALTRLDQVFTVVQNPKDWHAPA